MNTMKRKGFTLIELLGVIVVLAVITIITTPVILGVIEKSKKGALQSSGYGLVEAGILYYAEYQNSQTVRFDIKNNQIRTKEENKIDYKGSIKDGKILVNNQGEVTVCINDGKYAAYKNYKDNKIIVVDQKTCTVPENNYIVYLDNESTIKEMTNAEITSAITKLTERVNQLEKDKATLEEENKKLKEQNGDTEINSTITNSIVDLRNNLNTKANSSDLANLQTIVNNHTTSMNNLTIKNDVLSMYDHYLVNEKFDFNDLRTSYVILVGMDNSAFSGIKNAPYMDRSIQGFLEMNFATFIGSSYQRFTEVNTGKVNYRALWYGQWMQWQQI